MVKVPKYVYQYFVGNVSIERIKKRFKQLEKSRWGYKTTEYKNLKRYLKIVRRK